MITLLVLITLLVFVALVFSTIYFDLAAHKDNKPITIQDASKWSFIYVAVSLLFAGYIWLTHSASGAALFLTGYVMEKALSVDNLMVFGAVFVYFGIQPAFQHRILRYGIIGAIVFRLIFVTVGAGALVVIGRPIEFIFALFVGWSAWKMITSNKDEPATVDHANRWYIKLTKKILPITADASTNQFFKRAGLSGVLEATPILLCLVAVEITDVMFSFDSVPAVISVTREPVLIYSCMIFAIMGLRAMYFVLEALKKQLTYLGKAVSLVLVFVTLKLLAHSLWNREMDPFLSLAMVITILSGGILASYTIKASTP